MDTNNPDNSQTKDIRITGTNNKYLIKRANREKQIPKVRKMVSKYDISMEELDFKKQFELLQEIYKELLVTNSNNHANDNKLDYKTNNFKEKQIIFQEINKKMNSYKQQDFLKKIYNQDLFINYPVIVEKLIDSELKCYYCKCEMFILYEIVRELTQWTVDRIDNNKGHNIDNFVLSCLNCNIKRRNKASDKFLFTKNLNIIKQN
jgi:hypothetical protein